MGGAPTPAPPRLRLQLAIAESEGGRAARSLPPATWLLFQPAASWRSCPNLCRVAHAHAGLPEPARLPEPMQGCPCPCRVARTAPYSAAMAHAGWPTPTHGRRTAWRGCRRSLLARLVPGGWSPYTRSTPSPPPTGNRGVRGRPRGTLIAAGDVAAVPAGCELAQLPEPMQGCPCPCRVARAGATARTHAGLPMPWQGCPNSAI